MTDALRPLHELDRAALLALNNAHAAELSWLDDARLDRLLGWAALAVGVAPMRAALIAFDQSSPYDGRHFAWFAARYERFVYVDRVVVAAEARGQGLARRLYRHVFQQAAARGCDLITCEVNSQPANPGSDSFHAALGFVPVGEATVPEIGRSVRYLAHRLG